MTTQKKPLARTAQLRRVCCAYTPDGPTSSSATGAHWELYIVVYNTTAQWPHHKWPVSRRHQPPTVTERADALETLGYAPAPGAEWTWQESETPGHHGHPWQVTFLGTVDIVPLEQAPSAQGGED